MKTLILYILTILAITACNFEDSSEESGGGLFSGHKEINNEFLHYPPEDRTYIEGNNIDLVFTHSSRIMVTGQPRIELVLDSGTVYANYLKGSGTKTLVFRYTVQSGDEDNDGIQVGSKLDLNGGSLKFSNAGVVIDAELSFEISSSSNLLIDTTAPTLSLITPPTPATYLLNQSIQFLAIFDDAVSVTGKPRLALNIGGDTVYADYQSGDQSITLIFKYSVQSSDQDLDGIEISSPLELNGGTITDVNGNPASLTFVPIPMPTTFIDGATPLITGMNTPTAGTYFSGDFLELELHYNQNIDVTGLPRVAVDIGGVTRYLTYSEGTGTKTLKFDYLIAPGDDDSNGISIDTSIDLNSGTIQNNANINSSLIIAPPLTPTVIIDAGYPTVQTIIPPIATTYKQGDEIYFTLAFDKNVTITGIPRIAFETTSSSPSFVYADYVSGSGTSNIVFRYIVQNLDYDLDGIELQSNIDLNSGTIIGYNAVSANLDMNAAVSATNTTGVIIDAAPVSVTSITPPTDDTYITSNDLDFIVSFTKIVNVTNVPRIAIDIGGITRYADYLSGSGTTDLVFRYTVQANDSDGNGIGIANPIIDLNTTGTIQDSTLINANLDMTAHIPDLTGVIIFLAPVTIDSITIPSDNTYVETNVLSFTLNISENVNVTGTPRIQLDIGGITKYADYTSGSGTNALVFSYTLEAGLQDNDGIELASPLDLNGGTIQNSSAQDLGVGFTEPSMPAVLVDSIVPVITSIIPPADTIYTVAQNLDFVVNIDESINVTGTPRLQLDIGGVTKYADYLSGAGTNALTFRYTLESGLYDNDGISISSPIDLNGGTLLNVSSETLDLTFTPPTMTNVLVDSDVPEITSFTPPADATYLESQVLSFTVNIDENVDVTGTPRLQLDIGGVTKYADYISGTGSNALVFNYTIEAALQDLDGIELVSPVDLNGGTIRNLSLEDMDLTFTPTSMSNVLVDSQVPVVAITSPIDLSYINTLNDSATFAIMGTCDEAGQTVVIEVDGAAATSPVNFLCDGANFTGTIDTTSLSEAAHTLVAKLTDSGANEGVSSTINVTKDVTAPEVSLVTAPANAYYLESQNLDFTVNTSENVTSTGATRIQLDIAGSTKYANLNSGNGTSALTYRYTVVNTDEDHDGLLFSSTSIDLNSGSLEDIAGNPLNLDMELNSAVPSLAGVFVDGIIPSVTITSSPDITSANEATYLISGTCSEDGRTINVDIDGMTITTICSSGSWSISPTDVSGLSDNTNLPITVDHSDIAGNNAVQVTTTVNKDTATPTVSITNSPDIDVSNHTAYVVSGTCTENGVIVNVNIDSINIQPNCSGGTWTTGNLDVSGLTDNSNLPITVDHSTATQAATTVNKDTTSSVVTISSAVNITGANESSYVASGTCSDNGTAVTINISSLIYTPNCSSGSWTTGLVDVSSLADSASILVTADHATATQASKVISKNTATPTVSSLSSPTTLTNSVDLNWNLNDPGGFTINDYEINYRIKTTPTWLVYSDGVSTNTNGTITGLTASTNYEFRVRVQYNTSNYSDWSSMTEAETKPDDPLFSSPYAAMNVGGATSTSVVAYYDNTVVTLNGTPIPDSPLSKGQTSIISTSQFDVIDGDKPIFAAGILGSGNGGNGANMVWMPTSWAGKSFSFNATRANPQNLFVFATENATITVKQGSTTLDTITLTAGNGGTLNWSVYGSYQVTSTGTILAYHMSGSGSTRYDPKPILPGYNQIIGFPSNSMRLTADLDATNYNALHSSSVATSGNLNKQDVIQINPEGGTTTLYRSESLLISADRKISGASFADSNGLCAAPFLPTNFMKTKYVINASSDYVAFASTQAGTIDVYTAAQTIGVDPPSQTITLTRAGANTNAPYKARLGVTAAGTRFVSTVPAAAWYHPNVQAGSAQNDETILYGTDD